MKNLNEKSLTKGQQRKLNALRKSVGEKLGNETFAKWLKAQVSKRPTEKADPVAAAIIEALKPLENKKPFNLGQKGYTIKRAKGKGAKGFTVTRNAK